MSASKKVHGELKHIYGPVPSRRLGQSLGIDPIPLKTCNWNCVYCQLGRTRPVVNAREEYIPREEILNQFQRELTKHDPAVIDWVTFVGSGEPLLHQGLGWMIRKVKQFTDLPIAVITNGSLLYLPEIRQELAAADAVLPSLDAGTSYLYRKINRPHPEVSFERVLEGLHIFSQEYHGHLWPEVMLIRGLNDSEIALQKLADAFKTIRFEKIHLNTPTRPPVEAWVQATDDEGWMRAKAILGDVVEVVHPVGGVFDLGEEQNLAEAVLGIITRHPMREEELRSTLKQKAPDEMDRVFQELADGDRAQQVERYGIRFWSAAGAFYPEQKEGESR